MSATLTGLTGAIPASAHVGGPSVYGLTPNSGSAAGKTDVQIFGSGFFNVQSVSFGTVQVFNFFAGPDGHQIFTQAPAQAAGTTVDVKVTTGGGGSATSTADHFRYVAAAAPVVNGLTPHQGSSNGGSVIQVFGSGFSSPNGQTSVTFGTNGSAISCFFGGLAALNGSYSKVSYAGHQTEATRLRGRAGLSRLETQSLRGATPQNARPTGSLSKARMVPGGHSQTLSLPSAGPGPGCNVGSDSTLFVTSPPGAIGAIPLWVTTQVGSSTKTAVPGNQFTYVTPGPPTVDAVDPHTGSSAGGMNISVLGSGFTGATAVSFNNTPATNFFVNGDDSLNVQVPPQGNNPSVVDVRVAVGASSSTSGAADHYTYTPEQKAVVDALSPNHGSSAGNAFLTILGSNFFGAKTVTFGGASVQFNVQDDNTLNVFSTPPHAAGAVDVVVTDGAGNTTTPAGYTYDPITPPTITGINANGGPAEGGNTIFITGTGFSGLNGPYPDGVFFGGKGANAFPINDNVIQVNSVPGGVHGTSVDVKVTTTGGSVTKSLAYSYGAGAVPAPALSVVSPATGSTAGGNTVYLTGAHLAGAASVTFGGVAANSFFAPTANVIQVQTPPHAAGAVPIVVTNAEGIPSNNTVQFTYSANPPAAGLALYAMSPNQGTSAGGSQVQIFGTGFNGATSVSFGGTQVMGFGMSPDGTTIFMQTPPQGSNSATVHVTVTVGASTSSTTVADQFTWVAPGPPEVDAVDPGHGSAAGGVNITVYGNGLANAFSVTFDGSPVYGFCQFCPPNDNQLFVTSPAGTIGHTANVQVTTQSFPGTPSPVSAGDKFTFVAPIAPSIIAVEPSSGTSSGGTSVTIYGSGFAGANAVNFGNNLAQFFFASDDGHIFVQSPPGSPGPAAVKVVTPAGPSTGNPIFTYVAATAPAVSAISPNTGFSTGGTNVFISGTGLSGASTVNVGNTSLTQFAFFTLDDGLIQAVTPPQGSNPATVHVTVTTPVSTSSTSPNDQFIYTPAPLPQVAAISPAGGPPGTWVYVTGANFAPGFAGPNTGSTVSFCSCGPSSTSVNAPNVQAFSDDLIQVLSPPSPIAGNVPGLADIVVTDPGVGASAPSNADQYNYATATLPTITVIAPTSGPSGTQVIITGTGLGAVTTVKFGTQVQNFFFIQSDTLLAASAPGGPTGTVHVTVTSAAGTSMPTVADQYAYVAFEAVSVASSLTQYRLGASDGVTWVDMDTVNLSLTVTPQVDAYAVLSGNADLWTTKAGYNQDVGIYVAESDINQYPNHIVAWKESGGFAGTFSPNAAFVQTVFPMNAGVTYHVKLQWKANNSFNAASSELVVAGAGPGPTSFSPTVLTARLVPASLESVQSAVSNKQYTLQHGDGITWQDIDPTNLSTTFSSFNPGYVVITANADLWTTVASFNQDIGIYIPEASAGTYPNSIVAWKESGGFAGTYSPNAAFVQTVFPVAGGNTYHISLRWKTNHSAIGSNDLIVAGAGPAAPFSPTRLTVQFIPQWMSLPTAASNLQYKLTESDGITWQDLDANNLALTVTPQGPGGPGAPCQALISGNSDLWTTKAGFNQDIGIYIAEAPTATYPDGIVAWKESGGFAGTFSPNAAFVQTVFQMTNGTTYHIKLRWKTNKTAVGSGDTIVAGAGPSTPFSPTRLTVQLTTCS